MHGPSIVESDAPPRILIMALSDRLEPHVDEASCTSEKKSKIDASNDEDRRIMIDDDEDEFMKKNESNERRSSSQEIMKDQSKSSTCTVFVQFVAQYQYLGRIPRGE